MAKSHRELTVWSKGLDLACRVHRLTRLMPKEEMYRLSGQIIRCSASIPANIAEGNARGTRRDYAHFISIARGSAAELETFLLIIKNLALAPAAEVDELLTQTDEIGRTLTALRTSLIPNP